ncbi:MAG: NAD(P)H-dependent oxidoreductase [Bacteroidales bacterium]|nr:NAD(P)H-dependent oxidoreductase [Bacteroidales bacterium]
MKLFFRLYLLAAFLMIQAGCGSKVPNPPTPLDPVPTQEEHNDNPGDGGNGGEEPEPGHETASGKTLVVYYSYTGNCRTLATKLAEYADADVLEIEPAEEGLRYEANNYAIGSRLIAAIREKPGDAASYPAIKPVSIKAGDYDTIVIVTPLWWSNMAAIMQSYLFKEGSKLKNKNVGLIVSSSSSGISSVVADAKRLVPDAKWIGEALWINDGNRSKGEELVKTWWNGLNKSEDTMPSEIKITVSGKSLPVKIEDNDATKALVAALRESSISYEAHDYGGFEKVGALGLSLPANDTQITTQPGDVILYSGNQIVLFYGSNSWSYTRIGKIQYGSLDELKDFLQAGQGNITVTLSL